MTLATGRVQLCAGERKLANRPSRLRAKDPRARLPHLRGDFGDDEQRLVRRVVGSASDPVQRAPIDGTRWRIERQVDVPFPDVIIGSVSRSAHAIQPSLQERAIAREVARPVDRTWPRWTGSGHRYHLPRRATDKDSPRLTVRFGSDVSGHRGVNPAAQHHAFRHRRTPGSQALDEMWPSAERQPARAGRRRRRSGDRSTANG